MQFLMATTSTTTTTSEKGETFNCEMMSGETIIHAAAQNLALIMRFQVAK